MGIFILQQYLSISRSKRLLISSTLWRFCSHSCCVMQQFVSQTIFRRTSRCDAHHGDKQLAGTFLLRILYLIFCQRTDASFSFYGQDWIGTTEAGPEPQAAARNLNFGLGANDPAPSNVRQPGRAWNWRVSQRYDKCDVGYPAIWKAEATARSSTAARTARPA